MPIKVSKKQARSAYFENEDRKMKKTPLSCGSDIFRRKERTEDKSDIDTSQNESQSIRRSGSCTPDDTTTYKRSVVSQTRHSWPILSQGFAQVFDII